MNATYPYRLRLVHEGGRALRVERRGPTVLFDPILPPRREDIVVLTGGRPEQREATERAITAGVHPRVVAPAEGHEGLRAKGLPADRIGTSLREPDGLEIRQWAYPPAGEGRPDPAPQALLGAVRRPRATMARVLGRRGACPFPPQVSRLTLPDGGRLVHLGLSLHPQTDPAWLATVLPELAGAEWLLVGSDSGFQDAVHRHLPAFGGRHLLLVDLVGDARRAAGRPVELLTPLADRLCEARLNAYVLPSGVSYRFESA